MDFISTDEWKSYKEDWKRIDEMNDRPVGYPPLNIDEAMLVYNNTVYFGHSNLEDKVDELSNRIADLRKDPTVREYIDLKSDLDFLLSAYIKDDSKTSYLQKRMCNHPLYGVHNRRAVCVVCGKGYEHPEKLQELIDEKLLIADGIGYNSDLPYPIKKAPLKEIREYYLELYKNNKDDDNIESLVWEHFCEKQKQKVRGK